ncbi:MAG: ATP-binding protein [FCB group bacterium]|nr:ATP-binding protein [FCB group bacterium]
MINRRTLHTHVKKALDRSVIVSILGPRQCGKTTLAKAIAGQWNQAHIFDLENPRDLTRLQNPMTALENMQGLIVLDEIQLQPELFPVLRVLADRKKPDTRFLILGSASPDILKNVSETLAGRVEIIHMTGFNLEEIQYHTETLWMRGGFPRSYLADSMGDSFAWRENFVQTFLERDLAKFGVTIAPSVMRRFWFMLAHYHGQLWNASDISRSLGLSYMTATRYVDILAQAFMIRQLPPWYVNISKRQVKAPKIFIRDSGIYHFLIGVNTKNELDIHPKLGASWEGFVIEQIIDICKSGNCYFWRTQSGAELDLLFIHGGEKIGFEIKYSETVSTTKSMRIAMKDLSLTHLFIIYPGKETFPVDTRITAISLRHILEILRKITDHHSSLGEEL